jgi:hypothetical protein
MAVTGTTTLVEEAGNDVKVTFTWTGMKVLSTSDLVVKKKLANGTYTASLTLGVDYTATVDPDAETGSVTYTTAPVSGGGGSYIKRVTDKTQETVLQREGKTPSATLEAMADKLTLLHQELASSVDEDSASSIAADAAAATASAAAAAASAAAAAASAVAAAASAGTAETVDSGILASRPAAPSVNSWYYATDVDQLFRYIVAAGKWFTIA